MQKRKGLGFFLLKKFAAQNIHYQKTVLPLR
jgi:hypothetical protein